MLNSPSASTLPHSARGILIDSPDNFEMASSPAAANTNEAARKAGKTVHEIANKTEKAAKEAGKEVKEAAREAREGWKEGDHKEPAKK